jgi:hypothetical protein
MTVNTLLVYLILGLGIVLLLWIGSLLTLVALLRQRLKRLTLERDTYERRLKNFLIGQKVKIVAGKQKGHFGAILGVFGDEVWLETATDQVTVDLADIEIVASDKDKLDGE